MTDNRANGYSRVELSRVEPTLYNSAIETAMNEKCHFRGTEIDCSVTKLSKAFMNKPSLHQ